MQAITPCLWFDNQAEEAANFYVSTFSAVGRTSKIKSITRYGDAGAKASGRPQGSAMTVVFELEGQEFLALNGGPMFQFSPAVSCIVNCKTQDEVDELWEKLSAEGEEQQCGWLKDKYGVPWQIVPTARGELMQDKDPKKSQRVMKALLQMNKIDIRSLVQAAEQR